MAFWDDYIQGSDSLNGYGGLGLSSTFSTMPQAIAPQAAAPQTSLPQTMTFQNFGAPTETTGQQAFNTMPMQISSPVAAPQSNALADYLGQAVKSGADYFNTPYAYGGQAANAKLDNYTAGMLAKAVAGGEDYNSAVARLSGDGIGTGSLSALDGSGNAGSVYNLGSGGMSSGGYGYSSGSSSSGGIGGLNPYLTQAQQAIASQVTDNLNRNILPGLSSSAIASGNYGGSRQGVLEANALKDANSSIANAMANLSYNAYNTASNNNLQQQQINNAYSLGLGNLGLGYTQADNNFYTAQRGQDLSQMQLAQSMFNTGAQGTLAGGQGLYNVGNTVQQAPWQSLGNFGSISSPYTGFGTTTGSSSGSTAAGVLGGALGGAQLFNLFK